MKHILTACVLTLLLADTASAQLFKRNTRRTSSGISSNGNVTGYTSDGKAVWTDYRGRQAYYAGQCCSNPNCVMRQKIVAALEAQRPSIPSSSRIQPTGTTYTTKTEMREQTYQVKVCRNGVCRYETRTRMIPVTVRVPVEPKEGGKVASMDVLIGELSDKRDQEAKARDAAMAAVKLEDVPTPPEVIRAIFDAWQLPAGSYICEPCAGSAPFLREGIARGYDGWGVELNPETAQKTNRTLERGFVLEGDVKDYDFGQADAVFLYAYRAEMEHVIATLKPGCRVASFQNPPPGINARKWLIVVDGKTVAVYLGVKS